MIYIVKEEKIEFMIALIQLMVNTIVILELNVSNYIVLEEDLEEKGPLSPSLLKLYLKQPYPIV
jgi:hypothetical protein